MFGLGRSTSCPSRGSVDAVSADELKIFIDNDGQLYRSRMQPIQKNLVRKQKRGNYDSNKAPQAFSYVVTDGAKKYAREFDHPSRWNKIFPKRERDYVACEYAREFEREYSVGAFGMSRGVKIGAMVILGATVVGAIAAFALAGRAVQRQAATF